MAVETRTMLHLLILWFVLGLQDPETLPVLEVGRRS